MGECGARGGYMEIVNIDPEVKKILEKYVASRNTPNGRIIFSFKQ